VLDTVLDTGLADLCEDSSLAFYLANNRKKAGAAEAVTVTST
jgi:hypothetical protein